MNSEPVASLVLDRLHFSELVLREPRGPIGELRQRSRMRIIEIKSSERTIAERANYEDGFVVVGRNDNHLVAGQSSFEFLVECLRRLIEKNSFGLPIGKGGQR